MHDEKLLLNRNSYLCKYSASGTHDTLFISADNESNLTSHISRVPQTAVLFLNQAFI
jgi:hypothetical protein